MIRLLLDTQIAVWWLADDQRLTGATRSAVLQAASVHLSAASSWEVALEQAIGRIDLGLEPGQSFPSVCAEQGFDLLPVSHEDAWHVGTLPASRTDPFDRLIAATALRRGLTVVTADSAFDALGVPLLRA